MENNRKTDTTGCATDSATDMLILKNCDYLNVFTSQWMHGDIAIRGNRIVGVGNYSGEREIDFAGKTCVPGLMDGHIHLESTMMTPREFARVAVAHGTTAVVADPHEIANVLGAAGVDYILRASENLPLHVFLMAPSCVPSSPFDESGEALNHEAIAPLLANPRVLGLAEMMNVPGTLSGDADVMNKITEAHRLHKKIDGHAPGLTGHALQAYIAAGIQTDHECSTLDEAMEKLSLGQWIMIREGSAARNLQALLPLFSSPYCNRCLLVTDDKHPGDLLQLGHIDHMVRKAISLGVDSAIAYTMASWNAAQCFGLSGMGAIAPGYAADIVVLNDVATAAIHSVYQNGELVTPARFTGGDTPLPASSFNMAPVTRETFALRDAKIIGLVPGELLTTDEGPATAVQPDKDIVKLAVIERHHGSGHVGKAYLKGYGLKTGAIATSVAHDAHNLIVAGVSDADMALAANAVADMQGGIVVVQNGSVLASLPLPIAGLMSPEPAGKVHEALTLLMEHAFELGVSRQIDPFMTLSFVSLPVIPTLRLTTYGVVDTAAQVLL
ncbi:MAG TPA: adenine deaminase [Candidatus Limiplasma sp.]|nr:adenine deaminase [Candidatus Limiplasma sp.]HPS81477.1 adenine deaminase [Candidatus Limiplasma sp.]